MPVFGGAGGVSLAQVSPPGFMGPPIITTANYSLGGANQTNVWGVALPALTLNQGIALSISTTDASGLYSFGLYNSAGALVAHTTPATLPSSGIKNIAWSTTPLSLAAGVYYLAWTGNATVATIVGAGGNTGHAITYASQNNVSGGTTSAGALNANVTVPTYSPLNGGIPLFALY